nr:electron transfer flavoprotein subunit alpha/FixB family protein [uncultured Halomonas sp.]
MKDDLRRDPRKEWIARNRLHPDHQRVLAELGQLERGAASAEWLGPNGLTRRDPHAVGFIGPNGLKRIDRSGAQQAATASDTRQRGAAVDTRQSINIETPAFVVAVVPDMSGGRLSSQDRDVLGLARQLADADPARPGAVLAVLFGEHKEDSLGEAGIDRLLHLEGDEFAGYAPEARLAALMAVEREWAPRHWLLPDSALGGADLGRRLAARIGERPATGVWQLNVNESTGTDKAGWQCLARGAAGTRDILRPLPRVVLALAECAEPVYEARHAARPVELSQALPETLGRIMDMGAVAVDPAGVALAEAEFILSAGNGVKDWAGYHRAAEVLRATKGASRVAVDDGFMPRDRQVGATGTWVTARVYVAVGISGAIQHLQGIQSCDKVVAINFDGGCDMVKRADLAVLGDASQTLAALVALVERHRQQQQESRDAA